MGTLHCVSRHSVSVSNLLQSLRARKSDAPLRSRFVQKLVTSQLRVFVPSLLSRFYLAYRRRRTTYAALDSFNMGLVMSGVRLTTRKCTALVATAPTCGTLRMPDRGRHLRVRSLALPLLINWVRCPQNLGLCSYGKTVHRLTSSYKTKPLPSAALRDAFGSERGLGFSSLETPSYGRCSIW